MINVTQVAASKISEMLAEEQQVQSGLLVFVQGGGCSGFQYGLMIEENPSDSDQVFESNGRNSACGPRARRVPAPR